MNGNSLISRINNISFEEILYVHALSDDVPPALPTKQRGGSLKSSSLRSMPQPSPRHGAAAADRTYMNAAGYNTMASVGRSQSVKQLTQKAGVSGMGVSNGGYLTMDSRHSKNSDRLSSGSVHTPLSHVSEEYGMADYANLTEQGVPLVGNVEGLKLSKAQSKSKRVLNRVKRPLPDLPPGQELTFTVADLPPDFKGKHKPEILINGCVNYSACVSVYTTAKMFIWELAVEFKLQQLYTPI